MVTTLPQPKPPRPTIQSPPPSPAAPNGMQMQVGGLSYEKVEEQQRQAESRQYNRLEKNTATVSAQARYDTSTPDAKRSSSPTSFFRSRGLQ